MMDVYLLPVGPDRYECYYEAEEQDEVDEPAGQGFFARMREKFNQQLKDAERARHQKVIEERRSLLSRLQRSSMRFIVERIAEQRLLWHLRRVDAATLHISGDQPSDVACEIMKSSMKRDADRHRNRLILHSLALIVAVPFALVPGPNVIGYLFTFTVVGHYLAWRGAVNALHQIRWTITPNPALTDLRRAFSLEPQARHTLIHEVGHRLHLPRMARFVEQMAR
jgi:hypothetical protein